MNDWTVSIISRGAQASITGQGDPVSLSDNVNYLLMGIDGIGHAAVRRISERGPMQHGESDLGFRLEPRHIVLTIEARGGDRGAWLDRRAELINMMRADDQPVQLRLSRGEWRRQIDCYLAGEMSMAPDNRLAPLWQRVGIELVAPDPTWYEPEENLIILSASGGSTGTGVPVTIPNLVGASAMHTGITIPYAGTWPTYPTIRIAGPVADFAITNITTGDKLDLTGVTITAGTAYEIDCRYGYKSVTRLGDGANRLRDLTADSNLATFRIASAPTAPWGANALAISGTGIDSNTQIEIRFLTRYVGV